MLKKKTEYGSYPLVSDFYSYIALIPFITNIFRNLFYCFGMLLILLTLLTLNRILIKL